MKRGRKPGVTKMTALEPTMRRLASEGSSVRAIAQAIEMSEPSVRKYCKSQGILIRKSPKAPRAFRQPSKVQRRSEIIGQLASAGRPVQEIAQVAGLNPATVRRFCKKNGIELEDRRGLHNKREEHEERNQRILRLYLENYSLNEVGQQFGMTRERVRQILNEMGIKPRSWSGVKIPPPPKKTQTFSERFWALVNKAPGQGPKGDCWEWQGWAWPNGYGRFASCGKTFYTHRLAYMLHHRKAIKNMALHTCDNPPCVNPAHIYDGTAAQNAADRDNRGRGAWQRDPEAWIARMRAGALKRTGLTPERVQALKDWMDTGESVQFVADAVGLNHGTVLKIRRGEHFLQKDYNGVGKHLT